MRPELSRLPRFCARLCLRVEKIVRRYGVAPGKKLLLSISGGADSTALAVALAVVAGGARLELVAWHLNHQLRPEADGDAEFVVRLCESLEIPVRVETADIATLAVKRGEGVEETGRKVRRELSRDYLKEIGADYILLGHQRNDLCEDVIMRLIRGVGWPALGGMRLFEPPFFRPFLYTAAADLRRFLALADYSWREDASNQDDNFLRNRVRRHFFPLFKRENLSFEQNIVNLRLNADDDDEFWRQYLAAYVDEALASRRIEKDYCELRAPRASLEKLLPAARLRLCKTLINHLVNAIPGGQARADILRNLDDAVRRNKTGKIFQFPGNIEVRLERDAAVFAKRGGIRSSGAGESEKF